MCGLGCDFNVYNQLKDFRFLAFDQKISILCSLKVSGGGKGRIKVILMLPAVCTSRDQSNPEAKYANYFVLDKFPDVSLNNLHFSCIESTKYNFSINIILQTNYQGIEK